MTLAARVIDLHPLYLLAATLSLVSLVIAPVTASAGMWSIAPPPTKAAVPSRTSARGPYPNSNRRQMSAMVVSGKQAVCGRMSERGQLSQPWLMMWGDCSSPPGLHWAPQCTVTVPPSLYFDDCTSWIAAAAAGADDDRCYRKHYLPGPYARSSLSAVFITALLSCCR